MYEKKFLYMNTTIDHIPKHETSNFSYCRIISYSITHTYVRRVWYCKGMKKTDKKKKMNIVKNWINHSFCRVTGSSSTIYLLTIFIFINLFYYVNTIPNNTTEPIYTMNCDTLKNQVIFFLDWQILNMFVKSSWLEWWFNKVCHIAIPKSQILLSSCHITCTTRY